MIAAHINYLLRSELVFCCLCASAAVQSTLCYIYMSCYVNGNRLAKFIFQLCFGFDLFVGLFLTSIMSIFYVAIKIKFSLLNDHLK